MSLPVSLPVRELSPQLSVEVVDGKRLRVTTRCFRPVMRGPASAGGYVIVCDASGTGGVTVDLDGGQLAREPQEYAVDGVLKTVLEFDVAKILLHVKDRLEKIPGVGDYSIVLPSAVFHMFNEDMELFSSTQCYIEIMLLRDVTAEDFSESDIVHIQGNFS